MACRRFAGRSSGAAVTSIKRIAIALAATAAAGLAGCGTMPIPGSPQEQIWFDKAQGDSIHHISPQLRIRGAIGYPRTDYQIHRHAPRIVVEEP